MADWSSFFPALGELTGGGVEVVALAGARPAGLHQVRPGGGVVRVLLDLVQGGLLVARDDLLLVARAAAEGVQEASAAGTGTDPEEHEAAAHEDGEAEVHGLHGAPATAATKIEKHENLGGVEAVAERLAEV